MKSNSILANPFFRAIFFLIITLFAMSALRNQWQRLTSGRKDIGQQVMVDDIPPKLVVAHFMLGNTYSYTDETWQKTFDLAEETGLDGLALNLGPEDWQLHQAKRAFTILTSRPNTTRLKLFLSLDMNVLPSSLPSDSMALSRTVRELTERNTYLLYKGRPLLSTFSGHSATFGGEGWPGILHRVNEGREQPVIFMPSFFIPPEEFLGMDFVDGTFVWNNAWPIHNQPISLDEDQPFLNHRKPYMASVSPLFFTHYGKTGEWAFNKNWIYPSDNLLYPTRWNQLIDSEVQPDIIQVISWNDFGESHYLSPVAGDQPGSERWTEGMDHVAFREMTRYFIGRWRDGRGVVDIKRVGGGDEEEIVVFMWYRPHISGLKTAEDRVDKPDNSEWAQDLLNLLIILPNSTTPHHIRLHTGRTNTLIPLKNGQANAFTSPFEAGPVRFELTRNGGNWKSDNILHGVGREIIAEGGGWNYNFWSGVWRVRSG